MTGPLTGLRVADFGQYVAGPLVGVLLAGVGVACGLIVAIATVRLMSSLLFHVSAVDPVTYVVVCVGLLCTSALASYIPSRRAAGVDPINALKAE